MITRRQGLLVLLGAYFALPRVEGGASRQQTDGRNSCLGERALLAVTVEGSEKDVSLRRKGQQGHLLRYASDGNWRQFFDFRRDFEQVKSGLSRHCSFLPWSATADELSLDDSAPSFSAEGNALVFSCYDEERGQLVGPLSNRTLGVLFADDMSLQALSEYRCSML